VGERTPVNGIEVGQLFADRREAADAGVHKPLQAGISGSAGEGADSIVLNGGYEDDEDNGEVILYTGHGGNDPQSRRQVANQELTGGNAALAKSYLDGLPVRVIRGPTQSRPRVRTREPTVGREASVVNTTRSPHAETMRLS
jgi:putative restriction endonuclease